MKSTSDPGFAVIFDMDGVLIDSVGYAWQAKRAVLARLGIRVDDADLPRYIGRPIRARKIFLTSYKANTLYLLLLLAAHASKPSTT